MGETVRRRGLRVVAGAVLAACGVAAGPAAGQDEEPRPPPAALPAPPLPAPPLPIPAGSGPVPLQRRTLGDFGGWIELEALVHGASSRWLLDTGASRNLVAPAFVERHRLIRGASVTLRTALGAFRGDEVELPALRVGDLDRDGLQAVMLDPASLVGEAGRDVDGVLGVPFLRGLAATLDLRAWSVTLAASPPAATCPDGLSPWPLRRHADLPVVRLQRGELPAQSWLLDTGNPAGLVQLVDDTQTAPRGLPLPGSGWLSLVPVLQVGPAVRREVPLVQLPSPELRRALGSRVEGLAGTGLFDGSVLHLDLERDLACIEPTEVRLPGGFGMALEWRAGRLVVGLLLSGGPALAAGLREGEVIHRWADAAPTPALQTLWARVQGRSVVTLSVGEPAREVTLHRAYFAPVAP